MKYINEFRDKQSAKVLVEKIRNLVEPSKHYRLMEFCGGHTHAIFRHGLQTLLPKNVQFIHGPGCPVCILPSGRISAILQLLQSEKITLCTYGDVLRVPAEAGKSLSKAKSEGADIRIVYSPLECLKIANSVTHPVVFFAVGFETTAPATAALIQQAKHNNVKNIFVYSNHVATPAALKALLSESLSFDGILGPSHVSTITGSKIYQPFSVKHNIPIVVTGFEPLDILQATVMLIKQLNAGTAEVENEYTRAVTQEGNRVAQHLMQDVFDLRETFEWRGLGELPDSGFLIKDAYRNWDAEHRFFIPTVQTKENKACECPAILRGVKRPQDCKLFGSVCNPENPMGACMVSSEGACAAQWQYQRHIQPTPA